ncbi:uncharacterized protein LOC127866793 [Dreissena polymorpha]|uniref:Uncharacterized protein n=1 Tax=Dreissena polymorpha TaxID=45954 RepID=A0A9D4N2B3_DREPO|nr:uncharacterized protein LOC127866793 [Dreissena polymorpha]KAH3887780.1 hypothetical protein DPMN_011801 [Dreissena polymorpha]
MARPLVVRSAPPRRHAPYLTSSRDFIVTRYMQRPPLIMPNYGKKKTTLGVPKTSLARVLLYDNITQQHMLDVKLANIKIEKQRQENLLKMHKRAFSVQCEKRNRKCQKTLDTNEKTNKQINLPLLRHQQSTTATSDVTPLMRRMSTFTLSDVHLPRIGNCSKHILLKLKTQSGRRRVFHTYDESGIFADVVPVTAIYPDVKDDPRFQNLRTTLISPLVEDTVGFAILSPSFVKQYPSIPEHLLGDEAKQK